MICQGFAVCVPREEARTRHQLPAHHPQPPFLYHSLRRRNGVETFVHRRGAREERRSAGLPFIPTRRSKEDTGISKPSRDGLNINIPPGGC